MLHAIKKLERCEILSTDGPLGAIDNVYFDDERWVVRYLIVKTGGWFSGKKVLISPRTVQLIDWPSHSVMLCLTKAQIKGSPDIDADKPVSRQQEEQLQRYYGYPQYWPSTSNWATGTAPVIPPLAGGAVELPKRRLREGSAAARSEGDSHLRSGSEVRGYAIAAGDDLIGHVEDFLFDEETWAVRYLVLKTRNWLPGKHVLITSEQIKEVDWFLRAVSVSMTRKEVEQSPPFDPDYLPLRDRESILASASANAPNER
jgi:uncharacterized protein YrrD